MNLAVRHFNQEGLHQLCTTLKDLFSGISLLSLPLFLLLHDCFPISIEYHGSPYHIMISMYMHETQDLVSPLCYRICSNFCHLNSSSLATKGYNSVVIGDEILRFLFISHDLQCVVICLCGRGGDYMCLTFLHPHISLVGICGIARVVLQCVLHRRCYSSLPRFFA